MRRKYINYLDSNEEYVKVAADICLKGKGMTYEEYYHHVGNEKYPWDDIAIGLMCQSLGLLYAVVTNDEIQVSHNDKYALSICDVVFVYTEDGQYIECEATNKTDPKHQHYKRDLIAIDVEAVVGIEITKYRKFLKDQQKFEKKYGKPSQIGKKLVTTEDLQPVHREKLDVDEAAEAENQEAENVVDMSPPPQELRRSRRGQALKTDGAANILNYFRDSTQQKLEQAHYSQQTDNTESVSITELLSTVFPQEKDKFEEKNKLPEDVWNLHSPDELAIAEAMLELQQSPAKKITDEDSAKPKPKDKPKSYTVPEKSYFLRRRKGKGKGKGKGKETAPSKSQPKEVEKQNTPDSEPTNFKCTEPGCSKEYASRQGLNYHKKTHKDEFYIYDCKHCNLAFNNEKSLRNHMKVHTGKGLYPCTYRGCKLQFTLKQNMKRHAEIHLKEKHQCPDCQKIFDTKNALGNHNKEVHGSEDQLVCACGFQCKRRNTLFRHRWVTKKNPCPLRPKEQRKESEAEDEDDLLDDLQDL